MKENFYKYAIYTVFSAAALFSAFLVTSDNVSPFTTQATLHRNVATIAPEVSGVITDVMVNNGELVEKGQPLFAIDASSYQLKVAQAKAELRQARESDSAKWQQLAAAKQTQSQREFEYHNAKQKLARNQKLRNKGLATEQELDDALTNTQVASSAVEAANAEVKRIEAELSTQDRTAAIELAEAKLASAELDLSHTQIVAQTEGVVTNLQLQSGSYITQGTASLMLVDEAHAWISADFNEKGIDKLTNGREVLVSFDALPGKVFTGEVSSQERAIYDTNNANGQLSSVTNDTRWIREQQKVRTRITVNELDPSMISGSRASVIVESGNPVMDVIGSAWIHLVAMFRYIY
ncbi:HlyD family secretion protein [Vibrio alginolyticus]|uniref:HlyD family secretion protein n=1 Tax=Vibrio TaxID=662 RepID=UPI000499A1CE|nr:HlyD family secretion protein [Vibrio alginolyticus]MCK8113199.1 HlyD family secretion protein [Vibrio sp. 2CM40D]GAK20985.1 membrane fusion component of tripartite multidrug resistance system [Vibrio sp. JCM 19052]EHI5143651.1 HlyD family secretion protein [Vibrio alginolyticus]ELB2869943.1 HlyD family secretion protein [Vibrio alginolyticus]MBT0114192.1 HlyD family secretion protein [Vibrio alginolyticus]